MRKHVATALGETPLIGAAVVMEALGFSLPLWAGATMIALGVGGPMVLYRRELLGIVGGGSPGKRFEALHDAIATELDRIERQEGSEALRAIKRQLLERKLGRLKIPCPAPRSEATWRIFLLKLLVYSHDGDVKGARSWFDELEKRMLEFAVTKQNEGREE